MTSRVEFDMDGIREFCRKWKITEFALFGSVLREDFGVGSDIDVLVSFEPNSRITLFDLSRMEDELAGIVGRKVDIVSKRGIERSLNNIRRNEILNSAEVIYVA